MNRQADISQLKINQPDRDENIAETVAQLQQFRQDLYNFLPYRADALLDLIDALASNNNARSVVELSLNSLFRREYRSVHDAIEHLFEASSAEQADAERRTHEQELVDVLGPYLPAPTEGGNGLLGVDVTYAPRPFAWTLGDRT